MASQMILWSEVEPRLPIRQDPESREERKALFKKLLAKGKKTLTLDECQKGMKNELRYDMAGSYVPGIKEMTKTIRFAFKAASELAPSAPKEPKAKAKSNSAKVDTGVAHAKSKSKAKEGAGQSVDKREFHGFLLSLLYYLELAEFFEEMDGGNEDDQKLSMRECLKGKDKLAEWGVPEDEVIEKFAGVDAWVPHMKFDDFAEFVMNHRMAAMGLKLDDSDDEEVQFEAAAHDLKEGVDLTFQDLGAESDLNRMKVRDTFGQWDSDGSGGITSEELGAVMKTLNPDFTDLKCKLLFDAADVNKDGLIDFDEFLEFVFR